MMQLGFELSVQNFEHSRCSQIWLHGKKQKRKFKRYLKILSADEASVHIVPRQADGTQLLEIWKKI